MNIFLLLRPGDIQNYLSKLWFYSEGADKYKLGQKPWKSFFARYFLDHHGQYISIRTSSSFCKKLQKCRILSMAFANLIYIYLALHHYYHRRWVLSEDNIIPVFKFLICQIFNFFSTLYNLSHYNILSSFLQLVQHSPPVKDGEEYFQSK